VARGRIAEEVRAATQSGASCVATGFRDIGDALSDASNTLRERKDTRAASYVNDAAEGIRKASRYLEERSPDELAEDAGRVVRRHPAIVLGGLFAAGLLAGRFLRASAPEARAQRRSPREDGLDSSGDTTDFGATQGETRSGPGSPAAWEASSRLAGQHTTGAPAHTGNPPYRAGGSEGSEAL
jgi:hypothetical protein